jgi:hypothetical protein
MAFELLRLTSFFPVGRFLEKESKGTEALSGTLDGVSPNSSTSRLLLSSGVPAAGGGTTAE